MGWLKRGDNIAEPHEVIFGVGKLADEFHGSTPSDIRQ